MIPKALRETEGDRLKKSLKHAGMSVGDMAEYLEVHRNTVSDWVRDKTHIMAVIRRVWAEKVGVPVEWLRDGTWPENAK